jgi:ribosomal protein S12 methylthiotransferase accessory factor
MNFVADGWIADAMSGAGRAIDWINATDASTGELALVPADLCLRRPLTRRAIEPIGALSSGAAAGPSFEAAALRAVLELCERDAAAIWWLGGCRPKRFALEHPVTKAGAELIERLRQGETARRTVLLDITTDTGVPAVAAVSVGRDGRGMAYGLSSRLVASDAARAAVLEMCQMEMAAPLAEAKRAEGGDAALNEADRHHLRRAEFAAADCELLHPRDLTGPAASGPAEVLGLKGLTDHLRSHGIRLFLVDHTRQDISVTVARAVSPDLQPFSAAVSTKRFAQACRANEASKLAERATPLL